MLRATFDEAAQSAAIEVGAFRWGATARIIARHWDALSHFPDRRAAYELRALVGRMERVIRRLAEIDRMGGVVPVERVDRFARRHVSLTVRHWALEGRCMSWAIVGPARFPVRAQEKRRAASDKAERSLGEHIASTLRDFERAAFPHGAPGGPIRASNPDAPDMIRRKIDRLRREHAAMKAANKALRGARKHGPEAQISAVVEATGWPGRLAAQLLQPDFAGRIGFADFQLSGGLREIARLESRLCEIEGKRETGDSVIDHQTGLGPVREERDSQDDRLRLYFPGKPPAAVIGYLKTAGFRWAPSAGAWQRQLTTNAIAAAARIVQRCT